jgi:hypothetical protein
MDDIPDGHGTTLRTRHTRLPPCAEADKAGNRGSRGSLPSHHTDFEHGETAKSWSARMLESTKGETDDEWPQLDPARSVDLDGSVRHKVEVELAWRCVRVDIPRCSLVWLLDVFVEVIVDS